MKSRNVCAILSMCFMPAMAIAQDFDSMTTEELLPIAQAEGTVIVYSTSSRIARVEKAFEEAYPGIDLVGLDISSTKQIARVTAEQSAGIHAVDVLYVTDAPIVLRDLIEPGRAHTYVPSRIEDQLEEQFKFPLLVQRMSTKVLMYNEVANPDGSPVTNLWQLTTPEWRGRIMISDPTQRGESLDFFTEIALHADEMAEAYKKQFGADIVVDSDLDGAGEQFIRDLYENDLILVAAGDMINNAVGAIDAINPPVAFGTYSDRRDNKEEGWALQVANNVEPANGITFPGSLLLADKAPHPAAARLVIDFMFGDETDTGGPGFAPFNVPGEYATRSTIKNDPDTIPFAELNAWTMRPAEVIKRRARVADLIISMQ